MNSPCHEPGSGPSLVLPFLLLTLPWLCELWVWPSGYTSGMSLFLYWLWDSMALRVHSLFDPFDATLWRFGRRMRLWDCRLCVCYVPLPALLRFSGLHYAWTFQLGFLGGFAWRSGPGLWGLLLLDDPVLSLLRCFLGMTPLWCLAGVEDRLPLLLCFLTCVLAQQA